MGTFTPSEPAARLPVPWDVTAMIFEQADVETLKSLSLVCKDYENEAGRNLWRVLRIHTLGQGYDEAREHVALKLGIARKHLRHIREASLGIYSGYCTFWRSERNSEAILAELFSLLGQLPLNTLSINLDAYGPAVVPCLPSFKLPHTLTHLTISNEKLPNLGFLDSCLHGIESLKLRSVSHTPNDDALLQEPLLAGSVLPKLRHIEVDRANQLNALRQCTLPALESLNVIGLCRDGVDPLLEFLLSLVALPGDARGSVVYTSHSTPLLRSLSLRTTNKPDIRPSPSMIYNGVLLHPSVKSSRILSGINTLTLVHDLFPDQESQNESLFDVISAFTELRHLNWDILLDTLNQERVTISDSVLETAFRPTVREHGVGADDKTVSSMKEISLRARMWSLTPSQKFWVRRYVGKEHAILGEQQWSVIDESHSV